jgi:hypothetical protein
MARQVDTAPFDMDANTSNIIVAVINVIGTILVAWIAKSKRRRKR